MIQNQNRHNDHEWMNIIHECRNSGLTDKEWCSEHNIPMSTFYSSLKRLRDKACEIPVSKGKASSGSQQVVHLRIINEKFVILQKRLDNGRFQWPRNESEVRPLTRQEFLWLMEGLSVDQPKAIRACERKDF